MADDSQRDPQGVMRDTPGYGKTPPKWVDDNEVEFCTSCRQRFDWKRRRHHCRACGNIFCKVCSPHFVMLPLQWGIREPQRTCHNCASQLGEHQEQLVKVREVWGCARL